MTTIFPKTVQCSVCGSENEMMVVASTNTFGATDLDTRPPEMKRSTMRYWVQGCETCGYVAVDLTDETTLDRSFFETDAYRTCDGILFISDLAKLFYRHYLVMLAEKQFELAFFAALHAAWACDDEEDGANAVLMRNKAIEMADRLLLSDVYKRRDTVTLIKVDLLRRTGRFEELLALYGSAVFEHVLLNTIMAFERELARKKLSGCFTVVDAEEYASGNAEQVEGES